MHDQHPGRREVVPFALLVEGSLAGVAGALGWLVGVSPWQTLRWDARDAAWGVGATLPLLPLLVVCTHSSWPPLARIRRFFDAVARPWFAACTRLDLALIALAAGVGEEALFRGVLQPALGRGMGTGPALAVTGVLFGLLHPITPTYAVLAGLIGVYLGGVWLASGNLLVVVIAHALYDFLALIYLLRDGRDIPIRSPLPPREG
ncbi:MAG TPA: CPBP family intramembrane glutamic endopeptidase [Isosphaeraceae bacterium]